MTAIVQNLSDARRVSTPLVAVETPDQRATVAVLRGHLDGKVPLLEWDCAAGLVALNEPGKLARAKMVPDMDPTVGNLAETLVLAAALPKKSLLFVHNAQRFIDEPMVMQAAANLRDRFKRDHRTLVLLGPAISLPAELGSDVVVFEEPLPGRDALAEIIRTVHESGKVDLPGGTAITHAVDATQGLSAFQAEQVAAMSLRKGGIDLDGLWERKRQQIDRTPGLSVHRGGETMDDVGGLAELKQFLRAIMSGKRAPGAVVWIDEIDKSMSGATADTSGVSQDQLGTLLTYQEQMGCAGLMSIGAPGTGKSLIAKAAGAAGGVPVIRLDLGAAKGSLVGQSEHQLRAALRTVTAVSNGRPLFIATCNKILDLPPELRRRYGLGTWYVDLPTDEERGAIWPIHLKAFGLTDMIDCARFELPDDDDWTGAEIRQCCDVADRLGVSLIAAARYVVPVARSARSQLDALRELANGRYLSASCPGTYDLADPDDSRPALRRSVEVAGQGDDV